MLQNYLKIALRSLLKNKVFSFINILGLAISMAAGILILQYVRFELSYDRFHGNSKNIYRVATRVFMANELIKHETNTYEGISKALREEYPEVTAATTLSSFNSDNTFAHVDADGNPFQPLSNFSGYSTDSSFFKVFSFPMMEGNSNVALRDPYSVIVSASLAAKYFKESAMGKIVEIRNDNKPMRYKVTGVFKDIPDNSHLKFDLLIIENPDEERMNWRKAGKNFWDWGGQTYILLENGCVPGPLGQRLNDLAKKNNGLKLHKNDYDQVSKFELEPLEDIHLASTGGVMGVYGLMLLAGIIVIIAWVNYINLSTAISAAKTKGIGVRKTIGATRTQLIFEVLIEAAVVNLLAITLAWVLVLLLSSYFSDWFGIKMPNISIFEWWALIFVAGFAVISTLLSGLYPALIVSSFHPISALKGKSLLGSGVALRKGLVVFQFTVAIILITATILAYRQLSFMRTQELGIKTDHVVVLKAMNFDKETWSDKEIGFVVDSAYSSAAESFKNSIQAFSNIANVTSLSHLPGQLPNWGTEFKAGTVSPTKALSLKAIGIDYDFVQTLGVKLLAGRNFSRDFPSDRGNEAKRAVILNETAASQFGFKSAKDAVHQHISTYWGANYEIIGVINSFHQLSLKENLVPLYFILQPRALSYYAVSIRNENLQQTIDFLKSQWTVYFPEYPFDYFFLDQYFDAQYKSDQQFERITGCFTVLTLIVACLGLFGLASYSIVQRTKEIGVRKVFGATMYNIIEMLSRDFVKLILVASVLAIPLTYAGVHQWLERYAYRIEITAGLFTIPVAIILCSAVLTVSYQAIRTALINPVDSLRHE